jgi:hypothetical protein
VAPARPRREWHEEEQSPAQIHSGGHTARIMPRVAVHSRREGRA